VIKFFDGRVLINFSSGAQLPFVAKDGYSMADAIIGLEPVSPYDLSPGARTSSKWYVHVSLSCLFAQTY
jgi:hypothetical protein